MRIANVVFGVGFPRAERPERSAQHPFWEGGFAEETIKPKIPDGWKGARHDAQRDAAIPSFCKTRSHETSGILRTRWASAWRVPLPVYDLIFSAISGNMEVLPRLCVCGGQCPNHWPSHPIREDGLSVQAISWVVEHSQTKANPFIVLLMIANHAHSDGTGAWPSIETLARESRLSERTVQRAIRRLEKTGELEVERSDGGRKSNYYCVKMSGVKVTPQGCKVLSPQRCQALTPEPSFNRPLKIKRAALLRYGTDYTKKLQEETFG